MLRYVHFSDKPLTKVRSVKQGSHNSFMGSVGYKPAGLWFSVEGNDDGWKHWCEGEGFRLGQLKVETEIFFKPSAKLLKIETVKALDAFHKAYAVVISEIKTSDGPHRLRVIDWQRVAKEYDGIIIAPYQWRRRLSLHDMIWYYTWDCASGCVWNAKAIDRLQHVSNHREAAA